MKSAACGKRVLARPPAPDRSANAVSAGPCCASSVPLSPARRGGNVPVIQKHYTSTTANATPTGQVLPYSIHFPLTARLMVKYWTSKAVALTTLGKGFQPGFAVGVVVIDVLAPVAARGDVIKTAGEFQSQRAGYCQSLLGEDAISQDLTPTRCGEGICVLRGSRVRI